MACGLEPLVGLARRVLEQLGGVAAEIARLERRVGDRRPLVAPLDHGEQQIGVGVALRRMQHVVHALHRGRDAHRADMGRAFICPERQLHGSGHQPRAPHQRTGEQFGEIGGLLVALDRREQQLDRPFGGEALGLQRIGEARARTPRGRAARRGSDRAASRRPGLRSATVPRGSSASSSARCCAMQDRACRPRSAASPSSRDRKRASGISSCESGKKKIALAAQAASR